MGLDLERQKEIVVHVLKRLGENRLFLGSGNRLSLMTKDEGRVLIYTDVKSKITLLGEIPHNCLIGSEDIEFSYRSDLWVSSNGKGIYQKKTSGDSEKKPARFDGNGIATTIFYEEEGQESQLQEIIKNYHSWISTFDDLNDVRREMNLKFGLKNNETKPS
ncbi:hypothetical protein [Reichenbachiella versicolor]|uniref:hypothetical protein n=1 Tax=Reichenbachiella versicolor TaxID=1821036 RepID=UPI000D6E165C|nr:hypothetical protein [Reichenbachiella versicolor]